MSIDLDQQKVEFFLSRYREEDHDEVANLLFRIDSLVEEAQVALRQVAAERSISPSESAMELIAQESQSTPDPREVEEKSYSREKALLILNLRNQVLLSVPIWIVGLIVAKGVSSNFFPFVFPIALGAGAWMSRCIYQLTLAIDPRPAVAWTMVSIQAIPVIGWLALASLLRKAARISKFVLDTTID